ncbi:MAG: DUF1214 domain-containing protein [Myxococcaceae bacterium]
MLERRAVDAVIWGMPIVSLDAMRQAYFRDGKAKFGDIVWWPKGNAWKNQSLTPNTSLRYLYIFLNTKEGGPAVLELPSAANGSTLLGTIADAWQVPLTDIGFDGKATKYLILPPDYAGDLPAGYVAVRSKTFNTFTTVRSILAGTSREDESNGDALVKQVKVYPLASAANPPSQRLIDMTATRYDGLVHYDESFFVSLARMLNEEPVKPEDAEMMGMLLPLGIEKGKDFAPDAATSAQLRTAAAEAHAWLLAQVPTFVSPWWPNSQWNVPVAAIGVKTGFKWTVPNYFDVDSRGIGFATFFLPPAKLGGGTFYLGATNDGAGQPLRGERTYRLHVPPNVPVSQFWALTVYSSETFALFPDETRPTLDSLDKGLRKNVDGSVDLYLGPKSLPGQNANWIPTVRGRGYFAWFRFYGPGKPLFEKVWKLPDIEKTN